MAVTANNLRRTSRDWAWVLCYVCRGYTEGIRHPCRSISVAAGLQQREKPLPMSDEGEFRKYEIPGLKVKARQRAAQAQRKEVPPPRSLRMRTDQNWTNVWPAPSTFKWSVVPFPVRQGYIKNLKENDGIIPGKYANAELMKIPNFLHLTPAHVKKHCAAIKKFCTPWPEGLETDEKCEKHLPVTVVTSDYCSAGPAVRDERARLITVKLRLSDLELDYHARDKLLRLVGDRYNPATDELTFTSDRCPTKKQNYDYIMYLLTAVYHESWKVEAWEKDKTEADHEKYFWDLSRAKSNLVQLLQRIGDMEQVKDKKSRHLQYLPDDHSEEKLLETPQVQQHREAISDLFNEGENIQTLNKYKDSVKKLLNIKTRVDYS